MVAYENSQLKDIFDMYIPSTIYLTHVELYPEANNGLPNVIARLHIPLRPVYLRKNVDIQHVNNTDVAFIINQTVFSLYRWALINGMLGMSQISIEMLRSLYDKMFIKREIHYYKEFTPRFTIAYEDGKPIRKPRADLVVHLWHDDCRIVGPAEMVWCRLEIPKLVRVEIVGGVKFS